MLPSFSVKILGSDYPVEPLTLVGCWADLRATALSSSSGLSGHEIRAERHPRPLPQDPPPLLGLDIQGKKRQDSLTDGRRGFRFFLKVWSRWP